MSDFEIRNEDERAVFLAACGVTDPADAHIKLQRFRLRFPSGLVTWEAEANRIRREERQRAHRIAMDTPRGDPLAPGTYPLRDLAHRIAEAILKGET
jgi:hypothetical protein